MSLCPFHLVRQSQRNRVNAEVDSVRESGHFIQFRHTLNSNVGHLLRWQRTKAGGADDILAESGRVSIFPKREFLAVTECGYEQ